VKAGYYHFHYHFPRKGAAMPKTLRKPAYLLHKPSGQARVRIDRKDRYLGNYGSPESREAYDDIIADWFARQDTPGSR